MSQGLAIAKGAAEICLMPQMINRHGLIAGATGTGKTITLQSLAQSLSAIGVPVFMADVKGDLSGMAEPGTDNPKVKARVTELGLENFNFESAPVEFWDVFGKKGLPIRTTVSDMGPLLLSRLLNLNDTQSGVLSLVFKIADAQGLLLLDLKDLRAMLKEVGDHASNFTTEYGNISQASVGAIQRNLLALEEQGGSVLFGEPMLNLDDLIQTDPKGRGTVNILAADTLLQSPTVYSTLLLWLLGELFEKLPEVGDLDKPKLVFFFDEAHLLFRDAPKAFLEKIEQVVRLIRSKGVGVYFVTQNPLDIPDTILGQLGNRVQHALRAFTAQDQKAVKAAAQTFRAAKGLDVETAITELGVGEALISPLAADGTPLPVERAKIYPPRSKIGPIDELLRKKIIESSACFSVYSESIDRESAYEILKARANSSTGEAATTSSSGATQAQDSALMKNMGSIGKAFVQSAARAVGSQLGRQIIRGVLGSLLGTPAKSSRKRY